MAELLNLESGKVELVPDEQVTQAVGSGRYSLPKAQRVEVVDDSGRRGTIDPEHAPQAFASGYRYVPPGEVQAEKDEKEFGDRPVAAGAAGFARGLTFGLSDPLLTKTGAVEARTLKGLKEHNEGASIAGEIGGAVLPALIPGVGEATIAGQVSRLGAGVAERLGGGLVGRAAGATVEQGLFGAGTLISEATIGDTDLTGEKILAEGGLSLLLGAGGEAAGAGLRKLGGKLLGKAGAEAVETAAGKVDDVAGAVADTAERTGETLTGVGFGAPLEEAAKFGTAKEAAEYLEGQVEKRAGTVKGILEDLGLDFPTAEKWVLRDLDLTKSQVNKLRESKFGGLDVSAPRALLDDARYAEAKTLGQKLSLIETKRDEAGKAIGAAMDAFDAVAEPGFRPNYANVANKIRDELIAPRAKGLSTLEKPILEKLEQIASEIETRPNVTFRDAEELKRSLDPFLKWDSQTEAPLRDAMRQVRGILNSEIEQKAEALSKKVGSDAFKQWKDAKRLFAGMEDLSDKVADREMARSAGNRFFSLTDNLAGGAALAAGGLNPMGLVASAGAAVLNKWGRERLPHLLALWMARAEKGAAGRAANGLKKAVEDALAKAPAVVSEAADVAGQAVPEVSGAFGKYSETLKNAAARGAPALFALHVALSDSDPEYQNEAERNGLPLSPHLDPVALERSKRLDALEKATRSIDDRIDSAIDGFLSGQKPKVERRTLDARKHLPDVASLAANPQILTERLARATEGIGADAPATTAAAMTTATRAVAYLQQNAPKAPAEAFDVPALRRQWKPSDAEMARWERMVAAVDNPGGVLEDMAAGRVTKEAVEALRAVYPKLYDATRNKLLERLATHDKALDLQRRVRLGILFGVPMDDSMKPARFSQLQSSFQQQPQQGPPPSPPANGKSVTAANMQTDSERLLTRR